MADDLSKYGTVTATSGSPAATGGIDLSKYGDVTPAPTLKDQANTAIKDLVGGAASKLNPMTKLKGIADTLESLYNDPVGTLQNFGTEVLAHPYSAFVRGVDAAKAGKPEEAMAHFTNAMEPAGFMTEGSEVKAATPGQRARGVGEMLGTGVDALISAKLPEIAGAVKDKAKAAIANIPEVSPETRDLIGVASPRLKNLLGVSQKLRDAAQESAPPPVPTSAPATEPPPLPSPSLDEVAKGLGAKSFASATESQKAMAQAAWNKIHQPTPVTAAPSAPEVSAVPASRQLAAAPSPPIVTAPPENTSGVIPGWKPTVLEREPVAPVPDPVKATPVVETSQPVESKAPPSAWLPPEELDNAKTTGLPVERHMANRAAMSDRIAEKMGTTANLPTNQSEWARWAAENDEKMPSLGTQAQAEFKLNRRMVTKTETTGTEASTPSAVSRNPKALKIAQKLQAEMESSGTATKEVPSMPVSVKGTAADIKSVGPTVPGIGATVTLKNGKTVIVKELHPDGSFEYHE